MLDKACAKLSKEILFVLYNPQKQGTEEFFRYARIFFKLEKKNGKVSLIPTHAKDDHADALRVDSKTLTPITDFFFDKAGLEVAYTGKYGNSIHEFYTFTSVTNPSIRVYTLARKE